MTDSQGHILRKWLVLTHHLPPLPAYLRVKVRRRLEALGAVPVKSSVYALPASEDGLEDLRWLVHEVRRDGGEAFLAETTFVDGITDERLIARGMEAREADYREIVREAGEHLRNRSAGDAAVTPAKVRRLAERLETISKIDFFRAAGRSSAERAIGDLMESTAKDGRPPAAQPMGSGRTWVTRRGPKVDRIASAWLIKRFIDRDATFRFVDPDRYAHAHEELRFDMFEGEFTHDGEACTFETLISRFELEDEALGALAEIVHDLDCREEKFGRKETAGVAAVIDGIVRKEGDDHSRLARGAAFLDVLYEHFRSRAE